MAQDRFYSEKPLVHQHIVLINISELYGHEEIVQTQVEWLKDNLKKLGYFFRPILVAKHEKVILDGHHRVVALQEIGEEKGVKTIKIPCVEIEYVDNPDITLGTWHPIYTGKGSFSFPDEINKIGIEWEKVELFSPALLNVPKFGFTLKTNDGCYFCLKGTQQDIYKKFLSHFEPEAFDYAKTLDYAIQSVETGKGTFALLRTRVTKQDVIRSAKSEKLYAPKTTRHILSFRYQDIKVPLEKLFQS
ncbi:MAG: ParB N-terminal domain-containing protein [Candidatus Heimdallarchaeota archaeon]|nr:MAG: ParB N-terminal domain-containing protein [Candidatus Heimdallarchaeota archaeon]